MSQITKCYKVTVVLTYWEASGEVSELSYKSLLFISSKRSYCRMEIQKYDGPTDRLTWVGAKDACASNKTNMKFIYKSQIL